MSSSVLSSSPLSPPSWSVLSTPQFTLVYSPSNYRYRCHRRRKYFASLAWSCVTLLLVASLPSYMAVAAAVLIGVIAVVVVILVILTANDATAYWQCWWCRRTMPHYFPVPPMINTKSQIVPVSSSFWPTNFKIYGDTRSCTILIAFERCKRSPIHRSCIFRSLMSSHHHNRLSRST